ncbi:MAG: hypothetical protein ACYDDO_08410 [Acidiferrobacterales bacterium]
MAAGFGFSARISESAENSLGVVAPGVQFARHKYVVICRSDKICHQERVSRIRFWKRFCRQWRLQIPEVIGCLATAAFLALLAGEREGTPFNASWGSVDLRIADIRKMNGIQALCVPRRYFCELMRCSGVILGI